MTLGADDVQAAGIGDTLTEHDVGATTGHVGRDGDASVLTGVGDDVGFLLVQLGVEDGVLHTDLVEHAAQPLALLDARRADEDGLSLLVPVGDLLDHRSVFGVLPFVDQVGLIETHHRPVRRDRDHLELVDLVEFLGLSERGAGHARELVVEAEEVLERDRREGDGLLLDRNALLGFDRLVETVRPATPRHGPPGELVDDDHLAVAHDVVTIAQPQRVRAERLVDLVRLRGVLHLIDVGDPRPLLDLVDALLGERRRLGLLVDRVVVFGHEPRDQARVGVELVGRLARLTADDQRRARLVDEDRVHLVDDRVAQPALHAPVELLGHVVAEVVEAQLVVGRVRDVRRVRLAPCARTEMLQTRIRMRVVDELRVVDEGQVLPSDDTDRHPEEVIQRCVPAGVASSQVVVDRHQVRPASFEGIQVQRQGRDQRLAFAGLHLGDPSLVEHDAADQLHVEVAHAEGALRCLADHRERLGQEVVERLAAPSVALVLLGPLHGHLLGLLTEAGREGLAVGHVDSLDAEALSELAGLVAKLVVGEGGHLRLEFVDEVDDPLVALDLALDGVAQDLADRLSKERHTPLHFDSPCRSGHHGHHHDVDERSPRPAQDRRRGLDGCPRGEDVVDKPEVRAVQGAAGPGEGAGHVVPAGRLIASALGRGVANPREVTQHGDIPSFGDDRGQDLGLVVPALPAPPRTEGDRDDGVGREEPGTLETARGHGSQLE